MANGGIDLGRTKAAFEAAAENKEALEYLARAHAEFFEHLGVDLNPAEQKYVLSDLAARAPAAEKGRFAVEGVVAVQ